MCADSSGGNKLCYHHDLFLSLTKYVHSFQAYFTSCMRQLVAGFVQFHGGMTLSIYLVLVII